MVSLGPRPSSDCGGKVIGHHAQLRTPTTPIMLSPIGKVEVAVVAASGAIVREESAAAALRLIAVTDHGRRIAASQRRWTEHPETGVVVDQQLQMRIGVTWSGC